MASRLRTVFLSVVAFSLVSACKGDEPTPTETDDPTGLVIVDGNAQTGVAGELLEEPLVVRITTEDGEPVEGASVVWTVTTGGGSIEPTPVVTDADGRAEAEWTLGGTIGEQTATVTMGGLSVVFRATAADSRLPSAVVIVGGDGQTGATESQLLNPLVVRVENEFGRPVAGLEVVWSVESGGGIVTPATTTTDSDGRAQVNWTLGLSRGQQSVLATVSGVSARFRATAGNQ